jgi:hypothetical protein
MQRKGEKPGKSFVISDKKMNKRQYTYGFERNLKKYAKRLETVGNYPTDEDYDDLVAILAGNFNAGPKPVMRR